MMDEHTIELVRQASLDLRDYSAPQKRPIKGTRTDTQLRDAIHRQMQRCHVVVIPTGMHAHNSHWIRQEIEGAGRYGKPILAVSPRGSSRMPTVVSEHAGLQFGWNARSVAAGIWKLYRDA